MLVDVGVWLILVGGNLVGLVELVNGVGIDDVVVVICWLDSLVDV